MTAGDVVVVIRLPRDVSHPPFIGNQIILNGFAVKTWPEVISMRPSIIFMVVDLPEPLGPRVAGNLTGAGGEADIIHCGNIRVVFRDPAQRASTPNDIQKQILHALNVNLPKM